jgi:hypothetical protein
MYASFIALLMLASVSAQASAQQYEVCGMTWRNVGADVMNFTISPVLEFDGTLQGSHCPAFQHWLEATHSVRSGDNHKAEQVVESDGKVRVGSFTDKMEAESNRQRVLRHFEKERGGYGDPWTVEITNFTPT